MATAGDIVESALKRILVQAADAPLASDETADALDALNRMMSSWEAINIRLGYTPVDNVSDSVTVPSGAIRGIVSNLAIEIAPDYGVEIHPGLLQQAREGMRSIRRLGLVRRETTLPPSLPRNGCDVYVAEPPSFVLSLSDNSEATTFLEVGSTSKVNGFWNVERLKGLDADITGTIRNDTASSVSLVTSLRLLAVGDGQYTFSMYKSGVSIGSVTKALTAAADEIDLAASTVLRSGDVLELKVTADTAANDVTVISGQFESR
jgi:hypothetical protein